jgi:predicted RNase H-like nuclease (RuvC/YqgF family)
VPSVGWREGLAGRSYQGVCRGRGEEAFLHAYNTGAEIHRLESRISSNDADIRRLERELSKADNDKERRRIRDRLRDLDWEQSRLRMQLSQTRLSAPRY